MAMPMMDAPTAPGPAQTPAMDPRQAMQILQQMGISPDMLPQLAAAVNALIAAGMIPDEDESMHAGQEESAEGEADPYKAQIAKQLAGGGR